MNKLRRIFQVVKSDEFCDVSGPAVACVIVIVAILLLVVFATRV